jgi:hypothetical protein
MDEIIKKTLVAIPEYLLNFFKLISQPRQFPLDKLPKNEQDANNALTEALKFLLISYVLIVILNLWKSNKDITYKDLGVVAVATLVQMSLFVFAIYSAWKIFGSKKRFLDYFIIYSYQIGIYLIIIGIFNILSDGYLKVFDRELFDNLIKVKIPTDFNQSWLSKGTYQIALGIIILGYILAAIWGSVSWGSYRIINEFKKNKSFLVLFVAGLFSWIAIGISLLITSGLKK